MLKSVVLCVLVWHGMCEFSSRGHPGSGGNRIMNFTTHLSPNMNDRDVQTEPKVNYNFNITIMHMNGPLFGTAAPTTASISASTTASKTAAISESTTASKTAAISESTTASIRKSKTAAISESTTASIRKSTTASIPKSTTASISESTTAWIPKSTTASISESTTASISKSTTVSKTASISESTKALSTASKNGYTVTNGLGAHKLYTTELTWSQARQICIEDGGDLAIIRSDEEAKIAKKMALDSGIIRPWIGYQHLPGKRNWVCLVADSTNSGKWLSWKGYNSHKVGADYHVYDYNGTLTDGSCYTYRPFICKITIV